jgi:hypothetical protein
MIVRARIFVLIVSAVSICIGFFAVPVSVFAFS